MKLIDLPESVQAIIAETLKQAIISGSNKEPEEMALVVKEAFGKLFS